jgi:hypothetical protein
MGNIRSNKAQNVVEDLTPQDLPLSVVALSSVLPVIRTHVLQSRSKALKPVLRIRIHMFLALPDPDPLVRGMDPHPDPAPDPDTSIIMQK